MSKNLLRQSLLGASALVILAGCVGASAHAENLPVYLELKSGVSFQSVNNLTNMTNVANPAPVAEQDHSDTLGAFGGAVGMNFKKWGAPIRAEVEYTYRTDYSYAPNPNFINAAIPTKSTNRLNTQTVMVNAFYDINTSTKWTPFVGGGLGIAINSANGTGSLLNGSFATDYTASRNELAWALGSGVNYAITDNWSADLSYRYVDLGKVDFGTERLGASGDASSHELLVGARYQF